MANADQAQQHGMTTRLLLRTFQRIDHQHGGLGIGRTRDHVAQKLAMARRIDDHEFTPVQMERNTRGIDSHTLIALDLQGVEQEAPFDSESALAAALDDLASLPSCRLSVS